MQVKRMFFKNWAYPFWIQLFKDIMHAFLPMDKQDRENHIR